MFVTNHVLSGVLIGRVMKRRPVAAFLVGVGSHLILDSLPHWGCEVGGPGDDERFLTVAKRDGVLGLTTLTTAALAVDRSTQVATVAAMTGAVLLDLDKPFEHFFSWNPFPASVRRFHSRVQNETPNGMRNEIGFGFAFAIADVIISAITRRRVGLPAPGPISSR